MASRGGAVRTDDPLTAPFPHARFRLGGSEGCRYNLGTEVGAMIYRIALRASEEGYSASVPGLPGCWSQGATEAETLENIRDAIREYLAVAAELTQGAEIREVDVAV